MIRLGTILALVAGVIAGCASPSPSLSTPSGSGAAASPSAGQDGPPPPAGETHQASPTTDADIEWRMLPDAPFARLEMATTAHGEQIWIGGGLDLLGAALDDVAILDPADGTWTDGPALPEPLHHVAMVSDGERVIVIGGYVGPSFSAPSDRTWVLEVGADEWVAGAALPAARAAGAAAWDGERVVYGGGVGSAGVTTDVYALVDGAWQEVGDLARPREHLAAASDAAGTTWILGGRVGNLESNLGDVAVISGSEVRALSATLSRRGGVAAFWAEGLGACLTGGEAPDMAYRTVECVDAEGTITALPDMTQPRHGHGAAAVGGSAYAVLGGPEPFLTASSTVEALDLP